jgi:DNA-binding GntR family transcriptional regulator
MTEGLLILKNEQTQTSSIHEQIRRDIMNDRRGFTIVPVTIDELRNLHRARCMLNEAGLRDSIEHGDIAWEEHVLLSYIRISRLQRPGDMTAAAEIETWNVQHRPFHSGLIAAC